MIDLNNKADLQRLVDEGLEEGLTLDYKASAALTRDSKNVDELCKDVTAMANSAGGQLIYGIEEDKRTKKPGRVDDGVIDPKISREWIEQILNSKVLPRLSGITTTRIDMGNGQFGFVIRVPQSQTGPHQAPDQKYYKRFDLQAVPMHDYEIKDVMRRSATPDLRVLLSFPQGDSLVAQFAAHQEVSKTFFLDCTVVNDAATPATFAIVEVFIDNELITPFPVEPFNHVAVVDVPPGPKMRVYRRSISSPPSLPIFKQGSTDSHKAQLALQLPSSLLGSKYIYLQTKIMAQGITRHEDWGIMVSGSTLNLIPPHSPKIIKTI